MKRDFPIGSCMAYNNTAKTYLDQENNIILIGDYVYNENTKTVEFNKNTYATLCNGKLICLWIKFQLK